ncbi:MAG: hypothetical protein WBM44_00985 [Waterburya sp.]
MVRYISLTHPTRSRSHYYSALIRSYWRCLKIALSHFKHLSNAIAPSHFSHFPNAIATTNDLTCPLAFLISDRPFSFQPFAAQALRAKIALNI